MLAFVIASDAAKDFVKPMHCHIPSGMQMM